MHSNLNEQQFGFNENFDERLYSCISKRQIIITYYYVSSIIIINAFNYHNLVASSNEFYDFELIVFKIFVAEVWKIMNIFTLDITVITFLAQGLHDFPTKFIRFCTCVGGYD